MRTLNTQNRGFCHATKRYVCGTCGKSYKHQATYSTHKKWECGREPRFSCNFPGCTYKTHQKPNVKFLYVDKALVSSSKSEIQDTSRCRWQTTEFNEFRESPVFSSHALTLKQVIAS
ncbi:hypothetical protein GE061_003429 [Apolygus lucorum]|uniref:C2H2-type domain-containing protein n=1 Tax=Apolygus lucorum TaxID=248454 RepID=A0A8S9X203_APOLU|nr:hypothetical protein GE061_003429 [Apolygus lucorum]